MDCGRRYSNLKPWRIRKLIQVPRPTCWLPQWIGNLTKQNCAPGVDQNMKYLCSRFCDDKNAILGKSWKVADLKKKQIGLLWKVFAEKMALFWDALSDNWWKLVCSNLKRKTYLGDIWRTMNWKRSIPDYSITICPSKQLERTHWYWSTVHFIIYSL